MKTYYNIIKNLKIQSSYLDNNIGLTLFDFILQNKPHKLIEFGVLNGYSSICMGLALKKLGAGHLTCYDLWDKYDYNHGDYNEVSALIKSFGLEKFIDLKQMNIFDWLETNESFDLLHLDISNDGERLEKIFIKLKTHIDNGSKILFEGGTKERDKKGWSNGRKGKNITSSKDIYKYTD